MNDEELNAQIDKIHGPGAAEALEAAYADGSIFSENSRDLPDEERGMYAKYRVVKITDPLLTYTALGYKGVVGEKWYAEEVTDPCFVLKFDDPAAQDALWVYANSVKSRYPKLAADIKEQITQAVERSFEQPVRVIENARIHSINLVADPPHPEWRITEVKESDDG